MNTCIDVFKNLNISIVQNQLAVSPCCLTAPQPTDQIQFYNNQYLNQFRMEWKTGKFPSACESCQHAEESNGTSRRTGSNQWYQDHGYYNDTVELIRLDYWTGDLCNLACAICGPHNSSSWKQELNLPVTLKKVVVNTTWKSLDLSALQFVHFNGGEPLLSKEHVDFLQNIPNKNQVHLNYNTNGTILPSTELLALWKKFKLVQLDFSIDDVGEQFEFQRYPAEWNDVSLSLIHI